MKIYMVYTQGDHKIAAVRHLLKKMEILTASRFYGVISSCITVLHFLGHRSNRCRDKAIFRFSRRWPSTILDFKVRNINDQQGAIVPNSESIGQTVTDIARFFDFKDGLHLSAQVSHDRLTGWVQDHENFKIWSGLWFLAQQENKINIQAYQPKMWRNEATKNSPSCAKFGPDQ